VAAEELGAQERTNLVAAWVVVYRVPCPEGRMKRRTWIDLSIASLVLISTVGAVLAQGVAADRGQPPALMQGASCGELATNPADGLANNPTVQSASSQIIAASGSSVAYCEVNLVYSSNPNQRINIRLGLPLNAADGGMGGVQGAWNGRTEGVGGGGCAGGMNVAGPVNSGYVGSGTDTGHAGGNCDPGVNPDGTYNLQFINDFIRDGIKQQVLFSKAVASRYYGMKATYNYWNGCSTGGRQGYLLAQELGDELDGILASAPAMYWTRFETAEMWGQIVMKDLVGAPIAGAKLGQATASAVAACDAADGVTDGVIDDPRTCRFSATANVCGATTAPATNCLTPAEAEAIDRIWDGPRNTKGDRIWFGLDRGTPLDALNGTSPFPLGVTEFHWDEHNVAFDWRTVSPDAYARVAEDGAKNIADVTDTFGDLDALKRHGGKLLTMVGGNDPLIFPLGVINYYRQMAAREGGGAPDFEKLQRFYRLVRAPGVGHCGGGSGPQAQNLFGALVDWVEHGQAPDKILATTTRAGTVVRSRPLCPYPQTAIYNGTGSTDDAANFRCGGNLETPAVVCRSVLVKYKQETNGPLDYAGTGVDASTCRREAARNEPAASSRSDVHR
jgi:hypothetical protein